MGESYINALESWIKSCKTQLELPVFVMPKMYEIHWIIKTTFQFGDVIPSPSHTAFHIIVH